MNYIEEMNRGDKGETVKLTACVSGECKETAEIGMWGYSTGDSTIELCGDHALQLARKLLEDLCVTTVGGRHG